MGMCGKQLETQGWNSRWGPEIDKDSLMGGKSVSDLRKKMISLRKTMCRETRLLLAGE